MTDKSQQMDLMPAAGSDASGPVECLGQTFPSDAARRDHYLTRLRAALEDLNAKLGGVTWTTIDDAVTRLSSLEHWQLGDGDRLRELAERMREAARGQGRGKDLLQLWKDEVGFPHGEMDDILRLSDPPYYTACPNPFIGEFIAFYGKPYDPATNTYRREPFAFDVEEGRHEPVYLAHTYHAKVPYRAVQRYIFAYTEPGDVVYDGFGGTGMVAVACRLASVPPADVKLEMAGLLADFKVGARIPIVSDLSPIASLISSVYNIPALGQDFERAARSVLAKVKQSHGHWYQTSDKSGKPCEVKYYVWSDVFACPNCGEHIVYASLAYSPKTKSFVDEFDCPQCKAHLNKRNLERVFETVHDPVIGDTVRRIKQALYLTSYVDSMGHRHHAPSTQFDIDLFQEVQGNPLIGGHAPRHQLPYMHMTHERNNLPAIGVTHIHHFFTTRNLSTIDALVSEILQYPQPLRRALLFWLTSCLPKLSRLMNYNADGIGRVTKGIFYFASISQEQAPFNLLERAIRDVKSSFDVLAAVSHEAVVSVNSAQHSLIPSNSVDYIFTDPPFGGNIYYADLNHLWESWLRLYTQRAAEAIVSKTDEKDISRYTTEMAEAFTDYYRVLKPGRWITVEFHNSENAVWVAIQQALTQAGFIVADVRTLDKKLGTFKQIIDASTVKQDLIISAYKPNGGLEDRFRLEAGTENGVWDFVRTHLRQLPVFVSKDGQVEVIAERQNYLLFDRMVAFHVQRGVTVPLSASEFYAGLEQRFSERDGMYFLPEQVAEYDKKRMTATEVMQLTLFVTDEASAIQWLKQQLTKKPQTFQDLHPQFMRQIGGWSKHELSLELRDLLEQNFLVYDGTGEVPSQIHAYLSSNYKDLRNLPKDDPRLRGEAADRWYVPDPNKAGDLEKLRERALLREFATYRESKARKLKVFRLEAVRAGFKKAWGERDYATILAVAEKIPDAVLQEDPKLLMWYDQALTRSGK